MSYSVKEIFYSIQGEGANLGRPAVFCRFTGCNIWNGRVSDKTTSICSFCDTDFVGTDGLNGGVYKDESELAAKIDAIWRATIRKEADITYRPLLVFTGGEPTLQLDDALIAATKALGFTLAIETNGTTLVPDGIDWITVSPKDESRFVQKSGSELKLLFPFAIAPEKVAALDFEHFYLSPISESVAARTKENTEAAFHYCLEHPQWKLTLQFHKVLGVM